MVFASICEHASTALIFASTSDDQFSHASSEHFKKLQMASTEHFVNFVPAGIFKLLFHAKLSRWHF